MMDQLARDEAKYDKEINDMEVDDIEHNDLSVSPLVSNLNVENPALDIKNQLLRSLRQSLEMSSK